MFSQGGKIEFVYDTGGNKLKKTVTPAVGA